jgi:hypothetical protein
MTSEITTESMSDIFGECWDEPPYRPELAERESARMEATVPSYNRDDGRASGCGAGGEDRMTFIAIVADHYGRHFVRVLRHPSRYWGWLLLFAAVIFSLIMAGILLDRRLTAANIG